MLLKRFVYIEYAHAQNLTRDFLKKKSGRLDRCILN